MGNQENQEGQAVPSLEFKADSEVHEAAQAAAYKEPAAPSAPSFLSFKDDASDAGTSLAAMDSPAKEDYELTPDEQKQVDEFVSQIDITDAQNVMKYGIGPQKQLSAYADEIVGKVKTDSMGEVGDMLTGLVGNLKDFDVDEDDGFFTRLFKKGANGITSLKAKYSSVEANVNTVVKELEKHEMTLTNDIAMLDRMYDANLVYFKQLTMYIAAGEKKLADVRANDLVSLQQKAQASGLPEDAQKAKDLADKCDRFEKKIHDLKLTRVIALQTGPQIRMIQQSDTVMAEKIQSTVINTIPLWKNQIIIAIGVDHAEKAAETEKAVNDVTNDLLRKNADKLHQATVMTAQESERGIVDIETLRHTNEQLISTIDEVLAIQQKGREDRKAASAELVSIEQQLKDKLLTASAT